MYGVIKVGEREIPMLATGATPNHYKRVFHVDDMPLFNGKVPDENEQAEFICRLAYIMAARASGEDMMKLSKDGYVMWLDQFDTFALLEPQVATDIVNIFQGNVSTQVIPKKKQSPRKGR